MPTKQTSANMQPFNWRSNWETLLVFVIIVVGIVITTIAAIRSKDKHLLVIPEDQSSSADFGGDPSASVQVPPLPPTDFQLSGGGAGGIGGGEPPPSSLATRQKNARRQAAQTKRPQKDSTTTTTTTDWQDGYGDDASNLADDFHATRSSLAPPTGGDTEQIPSSPKLSSSMQGPYALAPTTGSPGAHQRPPNRPQPTGGGGRMSQLRLTATPADNQLLQPEQQTQPPPPPHSSPPPPSLMEEPEDMMTSYTRLPHQSHSNSSTTPAGDSGLRDFNLDTNLTSLLAGPNKVQITEYSEGGGANEPPPASLAPRPHNHYARTPTASSVLPFSLLLNDLIKLARPSTLGVGSTQPPGLEQPANSRPLGGGSSGSYGILQQMRSSFPAPLLALFQGSGASQASESASGQSQAITEPNHEPSESSHYQRISMSPSESLGMMLSRTLRATNPLPAFPPPKGTPQAWVHPNSGGTSVLNDAASNNADFVAGNTAGFLRGDNLAHLTSPGGSAASSSSLDQSTNHGQQQSPQSSEQQQQSHVASHPLLDSDGEPTSQQQQQQQQQQMRQRFTPEGGNGQQQQVGAPNANFMQQTQQQQISSGGPGQGHMTNNGNPTKMDDSYRSFKSAGALGAQQQQQQQLAQYPSIQQQMTYNNLQNGPPVSNQLRPVQNQQRFMSSSSNNGGGTSNSFLSSLSNDLYNQQQQQQQPTPVYNSRQIFSEILEPPTAHVPLGYTMPQLKQQQQQLGHNVPLRSPLFDFGAAPGVESAPRASISGGPPAAKSASASSQLSASQPPPATRQHQTKLSDSGRGIQGNSQTNLSGGQQPITLNAVQRMRRSLSHSKLELEQEGEPQTSDAQDDEEYLDSRPMSVVSPDGRPMSDRTVKLLRKQPRGPGKSKHAADRMEQLNDDAPLHHYVASGSRKRASHRDELGEQDNSQQMGEKRRRKVTAKKSKLRPQQANDEEGATTTGRKPAKRKPMHHQLDTASSGLMSKLLLGTASTNDELEDDSDGGGGGRDDDDESSAQERRKEELEDAEFGIVNDRPSLSPDSQNELGSGGGGSDGLNNMNEMSRLTRGEPSGGDGGNSREPSIGSAGSTDSDAYASRRQQQQTRSDVEFYGHPGEETRQLKYGILGSGNYEVVNGGIYPDTEESTAAVNSVANYVRKPGMLLAAAAAASGGGLPKLLGASTGGEVAGGFMPGGRMGGGGGGGGGYMRGASAASAEEMLGLFPHPQTASNPLLDMLSAAHGGGASYPFDLSQLGGSGTSARTTHASQDQAATAAEDDRPDEDQGRRERKRAKHRQGGSHLDDAEEARGRDSSSGRMRAAASNGGKSRDTMTTMESLSEGPNNRIRSAASSSDDDDDKSPRAASAKSQPVGTNQFYSYQLLPSKKVTIFSDQDLDSAPSEQLEQWHKSISAPARGTPTHATKDAQSQAATGLHTSREQIVDNLHVRQRRRRELNTSKHETLR